MRRTLAWLTLIALIGVTSLATADGARVRLRVDLATDTSQELTLPGGAASGPAGSELRALQVDVTGAGTVTYALTSRLCGADTAGELSCGAWDPVPIASGSIAAATPTPGTLTVELDQPRYEYRLTLTVTAGTPTAIRAWALYL